MQLDTIGNVSLVQHSSGKYIKVQVYPSTDLKRKMSIGTIALDEKEARRFFLALQAIFENRELPEYVRVIDMTKMQRANQEFRVRTEAPKSAPLTAQEIQEQNLRAEGRLPPQSPEEVAQAERKKKEEN